MRSFRVSFILAALTLVTACESAVQHGLDERQANEIQAALSAQGIEATKTSEGGRKPTWEITVASRRASEAVRLLTDQGLPRHEQEGLHEVYGKGGLVPSPAEERALYMSALSGELSRTLEAFEGVVSARVHLVLPSTARSGETSVPGKAAVFLRIRPEAREHILQVRPDIRALVAGSVEGLQPDAVTLVLGDAPRLLSSTPTAAANPPPAWRAMPAATAAVAPTLVASGIGAVAWGLRRRRRGGHVA